MALPARQLADSRDWLPITQVAVLTELTERAWKFRAEGLVAEGMAAKMPPPGGRGRPCWWFHRSVDPRLSFKRNDAENTLACKALSGHYPESHVTRAAARLAILRDYWRALTDAPRGTTKRQVAESVAAGCPIPSGGGGLASVSGRSILRWDQSYKSIDPATGKPRGVDALIDKYVDAVRSPGRSADAVQLFYSLFHVERGPGIAQCHEIVLREARRRGWKWPASIRATQLWVDRSDNREVTCAMREGPSAYAHKFMPYIEQDYELLGPGQMYVADHHQLKYFCLHKGKPIRPWLTALIDARTRIVVGWSVGSSPNSDGILAAMRQAFITWGVPLTVKIDNGKDFASKQFTGLTKKECRKLRRRFGRQWKEGVRREREHTFIDATAAAWFGVLPELGCEVVYAIPYAPWSKVVERWFRTFTERHARGRATFCETETHLKPESLNDLIAGGHMTTLDQERDAIGEYLDIYHATAHAGDGMRMSPRDAWAAQPNVCRQAPAEALDALVTARGVYKVGANGVTVTIGGARVGYGQTSAKLRAYAGRTVLVCIDPANIDQAVIFTAERDGQRRKIASVLRNGRVSPNADATSEDLREAQAAIGKARKIKQRAEATAVERRLTATQVMDRDRRQQAAALRATGTTGGPDAHPDQSIRPLQTGFDITSIADRTPVEPAPKPADAMGFDIFSLGAGSPRIAQEAGFEFEPESFDDGAVPSRPDTKRLSFEDLL